MPITYAGLALFSGGLDSILAMKTVAAQGLRLLGLHFCSPFFGHPDRIPHWREEYGLEIVQIDLHQEFVDLLRSGPRHGYGKALNPCVDCKILMLSAARSLLPSYGARFIVSGEVLSQRPMSQRRDALNLITKQAGVQDILLRPLSALHLAPTPMEKEGLIDRSRLHAIAGRGRKEQLRLARSFGLREIPTPAGGCLLAEKESAKRFWPVLARMEQPDAPDFELCGVGRQYWHGPHWLIVGRNRQDNELLERLARENDLLFKAAHVQGPLALGRRKKTQSWGEAVIREAAAFVAGFSEKYLPSDTPIDVRINASGEQGGILACSANARAAAQKLWTVMTWEQTQEEKKLFMASRKEA